MAADTIYSVLVVDDEPLARQRLEVLLERHDDVSLSGSVGDGLKAVDSIERALPDIVLLDIQIPGLNGIEVVRQISSDAMPVVIFVTAYEEHALKAFELTALDYLLKPYDDERFHYALARAKRRVHARKLERVHDLFDTEVRKNTPLPRLDGSRYLERIAVELRDRIKVVSVGDIDFISADGSYAQLNLGDQKYVIREQMQELEDRLDPDTFFRIHRSTIVRLDRIDSLLVSSGSRYAVALKNGVRLRVSRTRWDELSERLGIQPLRRAGS